MTIQDASKMTRQDKAMRLTGFSYGELELATTVLRPVGAGEVLVRVRAASLNYRDHLIASGSYGLPDSVLPLIPLSDGAGDVLEVGPDVERLKVGDRVTTMMTRDWIAGPLTPERHAAQNGGPLDGVLASAVVLPERALVKFAAHLDYVEAATLPIAALTAWTALTAGDLRPGQTVLCIGSGGVSIFALQLAKLFGARVIVTTGRLAERAPGLKQLGADLVLDYGTSDWPDAAIEATGGRGVDLVVENGGLQTMPASLAALRQGGFIAFIGLVAGLGAAPDITFPLLLKNARLLGVQTGSRDAYEDLMRAIALHQVRPVIDSRFPIGETQAAFAHAFTGRPFGKVVIEID